MHDVAWWNRVRRLTPRQYDNFKGLVASGVEPEDAMLEIEKRDGMLKGGVQ